MQLPRLLVVESPVPKSAVAAVADDRFEIEYTTIEDLQENLTQFQPDILLIPAAVPSTRILAELGDRKNPIVFGVETTADLDGIELLEENIVEYLLWEDVLNRPELAGARIERMVEKTAINETSAHDRITGVLKLFRSVQEVVSNPDLSTNERIDRVLNLQASLLTIRLHLFHGSTTSNKK